MHKHESVLEHSSLTVKFVFDRGVSHELVRHRLAAYSQSSTRYCNYSKDKFGREIKVIKPLFFEEGTEDYNLWYEGCKHAEDTYMRLIDRGRSAQEARSVLPNSLATEIVMTANWREWRHVFKTRCAEAAHPQIREVMIPLRDEMVEILPEVFEK